MNARFTSANGALALSLVALLTGLGRTLLDFRFVLPEFVPDSDRGTVALALAVSVAYFGGWMWALLAAARGSQGGLAASLVFALLLALLGVTTTVAWCPSPCPTAWPLMEIANWANLALGLVAALAVGLRLRTTTEPASTR